MCAIVTMVAHGQRRAAKTGVAAQMSIVRGGTISAVPVYRWTPARKALVLDQVAEGAIIAVDACRLYGLSSEKLATWQRDHARHGIAGLRATRIGVYRRIGGDR